MTSIQVCMIFILWCVKPNSLPDTWNGNSDDIPTDSESENIMVSP